MKEIPLTKGKVAIVDDSDYEGLSKFKWHALNGKYAARSVWDSKTKKKRILLMHREIAGFPEGLDVDHINLNTFDNRKVNLKAITHQHNCFNRPGLKGHSIYKGVNKVSNGAWSARITVSDKRINLGTYKTEEDAAKAYNIAALELIGEAAMLNDVDHTGFKVRKYITTSNYRGVSKVTGSDKWVAHVNVNKKKKCLGKFDSEHDAARMYNFWARDVYGEHARLNVIEEANA